ncbi:MAG: hypothetical protein KBF58_00655 [Methyloversatilis sp.]|jgi:hypothetical protein|nr:hypothetical protein [Methyloversatilis sp.]MBP6193062.1 hypothetical protein [Methyloversatilis sp.]MBP9116567.1 hypothetical protein [Methyloversatilis sp.]
MRPDRKLFLQRLIALLMLCALSLHALALQCEAQRGLSLAIAQIEMAQESTQDTDMAGSDCPHCHDDCTRSALCASAQLVAITASVPPLPVAGAHAHPQARATERMSHNHPPPERPPRRA